MCLLRGEKKKMRKMKAFNPMNDIMSYSGSSRYKKRKKRKREKKKRFSGDLGLRNPDIPETVLTKNRKEKENATSIEAGVKKKKRFLLTSRGAVERMCGLP